jgi:tRNA threonylcarbamoyladenosine biosynthesis protein TsaB
VKLLAIDTATDACSAALTIDGETFARYELAPRLHTQLILGMCEQLLVEADVSLRQLDALAFGRGPGSFTGVRIAAAVTQGMAFAWDLPVVPVSTLAAIAQEVIDISKKQRVLVAIDARMNEVYWGHYSRDPEGLARDHGGEGVCKPGEVPLLTGKWYGAGSGWRADIEAMHLRFGNRLCGYDDTLLPKARYIMPLAIAKFQRGNALSAEHALPVYLRDKVANKSR